MKAIKKEEMMILSNTLSMKMKTDEEKKNWTMDEDS